MTAPDATISYEKIGPEHQTFLFELYSSTREEELEPTNWSKEEKDRFLTMQFGLQSAQYESNYKNKDFRIILVNGKWAGRLYISRTPKDIRIVDIAMIPAFRGQGVGTRILKELLAEGEQNAQVVSIHVERENPAMSLYKRLGFEISADRGVYFFMEKKPSSSS